MKRFREFRTQGDFFYMEVNFLPETEEEMPFYGGMVSERGPRGVYQLRATWLHRYPDNPGNNFRTRFALLAHPDLSPVIVAEECAFFLGLIKQMLQL